MMKRILVIAILACALTLSLPAAWAELEKAPAPTGKVRYKQGRDVRFDSLLINGALQRPETLMVTGDTAHESNGILKLRKSFRDRMMADAGAELSQSGENR